MPNLSPKSVIPSFTADPKTGVVSFLPQEISNAPIVAFDPDNGNFGAILQSVVESGFESIESLEAAQRPKGYSIVKNSETVVPGVPNSKRVTYIVTFDSKAPKEQFSLVSE